LLSLLQSDLPVFAAALLIGLLTGRWMFRGRRPRKQQEDEAKS
jgi:hypothetical protein